MNKNRRAQSGFALIELIVVLIIIGVAAAITAPALFWTLERVEIRAGVKNITLALRYCRNLAISHKEEARFYLDLDEQVFWLKVSESDRALREFRLKEKAREDDDDSDDDNEEIGEPLRKNTSQIIHRRSINPLIKVDLFTQGEEESDMGTVKIVFSPIGSSTGGSMEIITTMETRRSLSYKLEVDPVTGRVKVEEIKED